MKSNPADAIKDTMWAFLMTKGQKANIPALKEYVFDLIGMTTQKTAGQRQTKKDISWSELEMTLMIIVIEATALVLSGELDKINPNYRGGEAMLQLNDFAKEVGENNTAHGFRDADLKPSDFVALIHSEVSEILEEFRDGRAATETYYREDGKPEGVPAELADVVIRCLDMADFYGIDLETAIIEKHEFNKTRPYKHGKQF